MVKFQFQFLRFWRKFLYTGLELTYISFQLEFTSIHGFETHQKQHISGLPLLTATAMGGRVSCIRPHSRADHTQTALSCTLELSNPRV